MPLNAVRAAQLRPTQDTAAQHRDIWREKGRHAWPDAWHRAWLAPVAMSDPQAYAAWAAQW